MDALDWNRAVLFAILLIYTKFFCLEPEDLFFEYGNGKPTVESDNGSVFVDID